MTKGFFSTSLLKFLFFGEQELLKYPEIYETVLFHLDNHHVKVDEFCHHFRNLPLFPRCRCCGFIQQVVAPPEVQSQKAKA